LGGGTVQGGSEPLPPPVGIYDACNSESVTALYVSSWSRVQRLISISTFGPLIIADKHIFLSLFVFSVPADFDPIPLLRLLVPPLPRPVPLRPQQVGRGRCRNCRLMTRR
jgi:hypothetical protein